MKRTIIGLLFLLVVGEAFTQEKSTAVHKSVYNILDFGAVGDSSFLNTKAIQEAVNSCVANGGGTVIVPPGNFITGSVRLFSNVHLYLQAGSNLIGTADKKEYQEQKNIGFSGSGAGNKTGILFAHDAENISIEGSGTINGNGEEFMYTDSLQMGKDFDSKYTRQGADYMNSKYGREDGPILWKGSYEERPGTMVIFSSCKNVTVKDINFKRSPNWTLHFLKCENARINNITIDNNMDIPNSDGIDLYDSRNITISDCIIHAGDDAIAVVSSDNVTAENCVLSSRSCGIRIGYNVFNQNNSGNLLFNNIRIYGSNRGIGIFQRQKGDMKNLVFSNMIIDTRLHSGQWWGHGEPIHISAVPGLGSKEVGTISNVRFYNITATAQTGMLVYGSVSDAIKDIYLDHVNIKIERGPLTDSYGGNIDLRPTNEISQGIFRHDIPALFANNVDHLEVTNFEVTWGKDLPAYFTSAIECTRFNSVNIDGIRETATTLKNQSIPVVYLHDGKDARVREVVSKGVMRKAVIAKEVTGYSLK